MLNDSGFSMSVMYSELQGFSAYHAKEGSIRIGHFVRSYRFICWFESAGVSQTGQALTEGPRLALADRYLGRCCVGHHQQKAATKIRSDLLDKA